MKNKFAIFSAIFFVIVIIVASSSIFVVQPSEYVLIKQFGRVERIYSEPGLYVKVPFVQSVESLSKKVQLYDLPSSDVITSDKKTMRADCYIIWKITDPLVFYQNLKSPTNAEGKIDIIAYNSMKNVISSLMQEDVIQGKDGSLSRKIMENIGNSGNEYGISILKIEMKLLDLPEDNKQAVYDRMISERNKIVAQYEAEGEAQAKQIKNEVDYNVRVMISSANKEAQEIIAEGEAEYMKILHEAYGGDDDTEKLEFYKFIRGLEATKNSLPSGTTLIIDDEYAIIDNLKNPNEKVENEPSIILE